MPNDFFSFCPLQKYYLIYTLQFNATFDSSTYLNCICLMLGISSVLSMIIFHITEYNIIHFPTFKNRELTKMNIWPLYKYYVISTLQFKPIINSFFTHLSRISKRFGIYHALSILLFYYKFPGN